MAVGIPVISTDFDSGVASQLIEDGINGFICETNDEDGMAKKIRNMLALSDSKYAELTANEAQVQIILSNEAIGRQWEAFVLKRRDY